MLDFLGSILSSEIILAVLCLGSVELTGWGRENIMLLHEAIIPGLGLFLPIKSEVWILLFQGKLTLLISFPIYS